MIGIIVLGFGPLFYAFVYYISDVWAYLTVGKDEEIQLWQVIKFSREGEEFLNKN